MFSRKHLCKIWLNSFNWFSIYSLNKVEKFCDGRTDGKTERWNDGRTEIISIVPRRGDGGQKIKYLTSFRH